MMRASIVKKSWFEQMDSRITPGNEVLVLSTWNWLSPALERLLLPSTNIRNI